MIGQEPITPIITSLEIKETFIDVTTTSDSFKKEIATGYSVQFEIATSRFRITASCEFRDHPLTNDEIQDKVIEALKSDLQASANITKI
jgi:hypothetical protein